MHEYIHLSSIDNKTYTFVSFPNGDQSKPSELVIDIELYDNPLIETRKRMAFIMVLIPEFLDYNS